MSDLAIRVQSLGKRYQIARSERRGRYKTLQEDLLALPGRLWSAARGNGARHETFWALKDISFEVKQGEVLGIIGRNGAGKSTLLKILANITEPTTGRAEIYGRVGSLLEVGTGFHPELTGRENIYLSGAILGMTHREVQRKFDEIVDFAGVEKFIDMPAKHYSSGMYMRLAFAVAAHLEPEILLVDEVLAVGDSEFQKKCLGKMGEVARAGRTVLFVSHNMAAIQNLCMDALLLEAGQLRSRGKTSDVMARYLQSGAGNGANRLAARTHREGNGDLVFTGVRLLEGQGAEVQSWRSGEPAILALEFQNRRGQDLHSLQVAVGIDDYLGQRIAFLSSDMVNDGFTVVPATADCLEVHFPRLPLGPGHYGYTLFATINGVIADWVQNAGSFDVEAGDFYATGKLPPPEQGSYLIDHHFYLRCPGRADEMRC